jgi:hypothetical protein
MKREKAKIYEKKGNQVKVYNGHMGVLVWESAEYYEDEDAAIAAKKTKISQKRLDSK